MMDKKSINLSAKLIQDSRTALALLHFILSQTPFYKDGNFDDQATFTKEDLVGFARSCLKLKDYIYTQLEINIRKDVSEKPTQQLGTFLKKIGLSTEVTEIKKVHGGKSYRYRLSAAHLNRIKEIVDHRSDLSRIGWSYVDQQYGFSYTNDEMDMIYGL